MFLISFVTIFKFNTINSLAEIAISACRDTKKIKIVSNMLKVNIIRETLHHDGDLHIQFCRRHTINLTFVIYDDLVSLDEFYNINH